VINQVKELLITWKLDNHLNPSMLSQDMAKDEGGAART
jgi:hypothetical protein